MLPYSNNQTEAFINSNIHLAPTSKGQQPLALPFLKHSQPKCNPLG